MNNPKNCSDYFKTVLTNLLTAVKSIVHTFHATGLFLCPHENIRKLEKLCQSLFFNKVTGLSLQLY